MSLNRTKNCNLNNYLLLEQTYILLTKMKRQHDLIRFFTERQYTFLLVRELFHATTHGKPMLKFVTHVGVSSKTLQRPPSAQILSSKFYVVA